MNRPLPSLLVQGFRLTLRSWPFVVWAYAVNLVFGLLAGIPFATGLAPYLDHSLAAQKIAGTIDLSYLGELEIHLRATNFFPIAIRTAGYLNLLQLFVLFVLFAGTMFVYVSAEPPQLSVLLRGGVAYFWRFVRAAIMAGGIAVLILGLLVEIRAAVLDRLSATLFDRQMFVYWAISGAVVVVTALLLRLWWDLVEVYVVRNAMDGEVQVRQALLPAFRLLARHFFRAAGCFLLVGGAGLTAFACCLYLWKALPAHQVWMACLLAQLGLFLLLASRFWQRGIEAALVMSADPPMIAAEEIEAMVEEDEPALVEIDALAAMSEPTLRDLVLKLRTEPLASPEVVLPPLPLPELASANEPQVSRLDLHEKKVPLGGLAPNEKPGPIEKSKIADPKTPAPIEKSKIADPKTPTPEKKP
jgi:hypothetical protein